MQGAPYRGDAARGLHASLEEERDVVHTFLYRVTEEILTPVQEAWLDTQLHPWFPDVWGLCNLLAAQHGLPPVCPLLHAVNPHCDTAILIHQVWDINVVTADLS